MKPVEYIANGLILGLDLCSKICVMFEIDDEGVEHARFYNYLTDEVVVSAVASELPMGVDSTKWRDIRDALEKQTEHAGMPDMQSITPA